MGPGTRKLFMLAILTLAVSTSISGVNAYFSVHTICKGWTESEEPILADRFLVGDPVYLYFRISWEEPEMPRGWSPERSGPITVTEPEGPELNMRVITFFNLYRRWSSKEGIVVSGFLWILNVTETTKNGIWRVNWYRGKDLMLTEHFTVGYPITETSTETSGIGTEVTTEATKAGTEGPGSVSLSKPVFEEYASWIIIAVCAVAVVLLVITRRRVAKPVAAPPPPGLGPPAPIKVATAAAAKYCVQCGELIPEVAVYCPRCASRQE